MFKPLPTSYVFTKIKFRKMNQLSSFYKLQCIKTPLFLINFPLKRGEKRNLAAYNISIFLCRDFMWPGEGQFPIGRYWISSSVHMDFDNEESVGHRLPAATPSNIHHCWLNSRQLPIGRVSNLYPATSVHTQSQYNQMGLKWSTK